MTFENNAQKKCGFCGESIPVRAGRCPYCGSLLEVTFDSTPNQDADKSPGIPDGVKPGDAGQVQYGQDAQVNQDVLPPQDNANQYANNESNESSMPQDGVGKQPEQKSGMQGSNGANYNNRYMPDQNFSNKYAYTPLSNGLKVFLTALFILIPGIGQLAGIITAIVFMNSEGDSDRKSFGVALLVLSLIMFVFACIGCFVIAIYASSINQYSF
ncbi:MAG: hypothetical protein ABFD25_14215 [Clostridiaceae bacterium]